MTRTGRRYGTKSLACPKCKLRVKTGSGRNGLTFRGKTMERLLKHLREVHNEKM
jgi:hypothetical protein